VSYLHGNYSGELHRLVATGTLQGDHSEANHAVLFLGEVKTTATQQIKQRNEKK
jgi:hypothetical protein